MVEDQNFFYSYDLRGNLIQKSAKIGPEVTTLRWDYFDRLVQVETSQKRVSYKYDATGRRIERLMEDLVNATSKVNKWTYLNDEQWSEMNDLNQVLAVTLNGESIDDITSLSITPGIALDPVKNHLGSIRAWVNADTGAVVQSQKYSAYGETTVTQSSPVLASLGMLRGFTGRELDVDTKFQHNRARWYDPFEGRFFSQDPIDFKGRDTNLYRYVKNHPAMLTDPSGQFWQFIIPIIGAGFWTYIIDDVFTGLKDDDKTIDWSPWQDKKHLDESDKYFKKMLQDDERFRCG